jgi:hypothetical protein
MPGVAKRQPAEPPDSGQMGQMFSIAALLEKKNFLEKRAFSVDISFFLV